MHPGKGYNFLDDFLDQSVGFLDFPGLSTQNTPLSKWDGLKVALIQSTMLGAMLREEKDKAETDPSKIEVTSKRASQKRQRERNAVISLLETAQAGDLVVLPSKKYMSRVWIGRITSNKIVNCLHPKHYGPVPIPGRHIDWARNYDEGSLSRPLRDILRHPHPFSLLERSLYPEVFALSYDSYVYGDRHASTVFNGDEFLDADASLLSNISKLAAAACRILDQGGSETELTQESLLSILLTNPPIEYTSNQEADIHSIGFNRYTSGRPVPLVAGALLMALIVLSGCSDKDEAKTKIEALEFVNSSGGADPLCDAGVSRATKLALSFMPIDPIWEACNAARESAKRGLRPSARPARPKP